MKQTLKIILLSALATGTVIKGVPALAEPVAADVNVSVVHTADLDLTSEAGQRALDRRLSTAATQVCGSASTADLSGQNGERSCVRSVLSAARARSAELVARRTIVESIQVAAR